MRQQVISKPSAEMMQQESVFFLKKSILLPQQQHFFEPRGNLDGGERQVSKKFT